MLVSGKGMYVLWAFLATLFTWGMTAAGASTVFLFREVKKEVMDCLLGFASGIMIAASFWSLLSPALEMAGERTSFPFIEVGIGFLVGGLFLWGIDSFLPHLHVGATKPEGLKTKWNRNVLLVLAITLHNIPEGLSIGILFGAMAAGDNGVSMASAIALTIGMGIQNLPEGAAVSIPLRRDGMSRGKAFFYGQASGVVEPIAAMVGVVLAISISHILPFFLAFAAGAMIYVVIEELIPEAQNSHLTNLVTLSAMVGFTLMMVLDVALG